MRRTIRWVTTVVLSGVVGALALAGCTGAQDGGAATPPPTAPAPTESGTPTAGPTSAAPSGPRAEPRPLGLLPPEEVDELDEEYVMAVMAELNHVEGEIARHVVDAGRELDETFHAWMRSLYTADNATTQIAGWERLDLDLLRDDPQDPETRDVKIVSASPECLFFSAEHYLDPLLVEPHWAEQPYWIQLVPAEPDDVNPTHWAVASFTWYRDGSTPQDRCAG